MRKQIPVWSGLVKYFPDALALVSMVSVEGNKQHGTGLRWERDRSPDDLDSMMRHLLDASDEAATPDERLEHMARTAWRALAALQRQFEENDEMELRPYARGND